MLDRLRADAAFQQVKWDDVLDPREYVGRAPEQTTEFLEEMIDPVVRRYAGGPAGDAAIEL